MARGRFGSRSQWVAAVICASLGVALFSFVDLEPQVDEDFFFSTDDPQLRQSLEIEKEFGSPEQVFVAVQSERLVSRAYVQKVLRLTESLRAVDGVTDARSLTHGIEKPEKVAEREPAEIFEDLLDSPFWTQLILAPDNSATFIVLRLDESNTEAAIREIDRVLHDSAESGITLAATGVPYVGEQIRAQLSEDLRRFSIAAFVVFAILVGVLFRSFAVVVGTMVAALAASFATFLVRAALGMETDILAPNLWTIAFVLTLSHVVYLTAQWRREATSVGAEEAARRSVALTGPASAWSLLANLLGFATLIFVSAKPLREFGISGAIAAVLAIACAYLLFPPFLRAADPGRERAGWLSSALGAFFTARHPWAAGIAVIAAVVLAPFAWRADTDPSLPSYFAEDGRIGEGLRTIDAAAGSSPLEIVVADANGGELDTDEAFKRLQALHTSLRKHPDVGSVLSIALLMKETDRRWYSFLFPWDLELGQLEKPKHGRIADAFISEDRRRGLFIVRMREMSRERDREGIVSDLKAIVRDHGFEPELTGGLYLLQGELSKLVEGSVLRGLGGLLALFFLIVLIVSRSLWTATAMALCLALTPLLLFGAVGLFRMPLDIIAAPAANVALPLGIDEMIHLSYRLRRKRKGRKVSWGVWREALGELWKPILAAMLIVLSGFSLFLLSTFPPTQRLGVLVCAGAAITDIFVLVVLPAVASRRKSQSPNKERVCLAKTLSPLSKSHPG